MCATSWVGVMRLPTVEIRVRPKLVGDNLHLAQMIDFATGASIVQRETARASFEAAGESLFDLIALLFVEASESVVRRGLISDYKSDEADLPVVRGRILVDQQVLRRFGLFDKVVCRYDDYQPNVPENQLILAAIRQASRSVVSAAVRHRLERLRHVFESACSTSGFEPSYAGRSIAYSRLNAYYLPAHTLGALLLDGLGVDDLYAGQHGGSSFFLDMNTLFQAFVEAWLVKILPQALYRVRKQVRNKSVVWDLTSDVSYSSIIPDFIVDAVSQRLAVPLDAKYKRYDHGVNESDIYQAFLYAWALSNPALGSQRKALIIHPVDSTDVTVTRLQVKRPSAAGEAVVVAVIGVPIAGAIDETVTGSSGAITSLILREINPTPPVAMAS